MEPIPLHVHVACDQCGHKAGYMLIVITGGKRRMLCQTCADEVEDSHDVE